MISVILASQSPYRKAQLQNFGIQFIAKKPLVDEFELKKLGPKDLTELTRFLAYAKAESLKSTCPESLILGSDQLAEVGGVRLDKPGSLENAFSQLKMLNAKEHCLITSLSLIFKNKSVTLTDITRIKFKNLTDKTIKSYLNTDTPFDCAGSYKIEKAGLALIDSIQSEDPSAIQGLPLLSFMKGLCELNIPIEDLWSPK